MDVVHNSIGCIGVLALLVIIMHQTTQVVANASPSVCEVGKRMLGAMALDRGVPNLDSQHMRGVRAARKRTSRVYSEHGFVASSKSEDRGDYNP